jgi:hypothetical protein
VSDWDIEQREVVVAALGVAAEAFGQDGFAKARLSKASMALQDMIREYVRSGEKRRRAHEEEIIRARQTGPPKKPKG